MIGRIDVNNNFLEIDGDVILEDNGKEHTVHLKLSRQDIIKVSQRIIQYLNLVNKIAFEGADGDIVEIEKTMVEDLKPLINVSVLKSHEKKINTILQIYTQITNEFVK